MSEDATTYLRSDDALGPLVERYGPLELDPADDAFARLVTAVCNQQVSSAAAATIRERLFDAVTVTPGGIQRADSERLREAGLSRQKTATVQALAERFDTEGWTRATFADWSNDRVREELTSVRGVGDWTVDMFLIFGLGRPDVYPAGDLAVRRATAGIAGVEADDREQLRAYARRWQPYRSYAACYLWHDYEDGQPNVD